MSKDYYQVLGVPRGADKKDIKKAYFKLVRCFTPEKEPERFQEIREAYENLMAQGEGQDQGLAMAVPDDPFAMKMLQQVQDLMRAQRYGQASRTAEEAIRCFGKYEAFLYYLAIAQRHDGHTGKSVKNFEELVERYPDKAVYRRELAVSYLDRGYVNKAYWAFGEAHDRGISDDDFLLMYSLCCQDRERLQEAADLLRELVGKENRNLKDTMEEMLEAYTGLLMLSMTGYVDFCETALSFVRFIDDASAWLDEYEDAVIELATAMLIACSMTGSAGIPTADEMMEKLDRLIPGEKLEGLKQACFADRERTALDRDERLSAVSKMGYEAFVDVPEEYEDTPQLIRFMRLDVQLCMIEEWAGIRRELDIIKKDYPQYYEALGGFLEQMEHPEKIPIYKERLLKEYDRLVSGLGDGYYYEKYPQMRRRTMDISWDSEEEGTFVRKGRKIGRNDPCPCGSGKKYKNCCGRK